MCYNTNCGDFMKKRLLLLVFIVFIKVLFDDEEIILGTDEGVVIESEADINGDTSVNITDVVALTNIILGQ